MSLFGAATSGVDPKSGSYLSKEQRIAMFQASRGQGGGGSASGGKGPKAQVSPQSTIVVANKSIQVVQSLNSNFQVATQNVAQQVEQNRKDIKTIFTIINNDREETLKNEKRENQLALRAAEDARRSRKESFVEGISNAAAAAVKPLQKAAAAISKPVKSFWDKLKRALLSLAGAWAIDNLPELLETFDKYFGDLESLKSTVSDALVKLRFVLTRGATSLINGIIKLVSGIATTAYKVSRFIFSSAAKIGKVVFNAIKWFVQTVWDFAWEAIKGLKNLLKPPADVPKTNPVPDKPVVPETNKPVMPDANKPVVPATNPNDLVDLDVNKPTGLTPDDVATKADDVPWWKKLNPFKGKKAEPKVSEAVKNSSFERLVRRTLSYIPQLTPEAIEGLVKNARKLTKVPIVGPAIDILINATLGQPLGEAALRGLGSALVGIKGAAAGGAIGAKAGAVLGLPFGGVGAIPGSLIGGALGSLVGGFLGSYVGDRSVKGAMEMTGLETTSDEEMSENLKGIITKVVGDGETMAPPPEPVVEAAPSSTTMMPTSGSTPDGMQLDDPTGASSVSKVTVIDAPPTMEKIEANKGDEVLPEQKVAAIRTRDPETDVYRSLASSYYQMDYSGAFA